MFRFCLSLCIFFVLIGCQPTQKSDHPGNDNQAHEPRTAPEPTSLEDIRSFDNRTKNYNMLGVKKSKNWLRDKGYTVTEINGNAFLIEKNGKEMTTIEKGSRAHYSVEETLFTHDDEGNIRVGFFHEE